MLLEQMSAAAVLGAALSLLPLLLAAAESVALSAPVLFVVVLGLSLRRLRAPRPWTTALACTVVALSFDIVLLAASGTNIPELIRSHRFGAEILFARSLFAYPLVCALVTALFNAGTTALWPRLLVVGAVLGSLYGYNARVERLRFHKFQEDSARSMEFTAYLPEKPIPVPGLRFRQLDLAPNWILMRYFSEIQSGKKAGALFIAQFSDQGRFMPPSDCGPADIVDVLIHRDRSPNPCKRVLTAGNGRDAYRSLSGSIPNRYLFVRMGATMVVIDDIRQVLSAVPPKELRAWIESFRESAGDELLRVARARNLPAGAPRRRSRR